MKKEKTPDLRPWYKKKRYLIPLGWVAITLFIMIVNPKSSDVEPTEQKTAIVEKTETIEEVTANFEKEESEKRAKLKSKIEKELDALNKDDDLMDGEFTSINDVTIVLGIISYYNLIIKEGNYSNDKEILRTTKLLEKKVSEVQKKNFPKLRKAYYEIVRPKLWENDMYLTLSGKNNTILALRGGLFAANKNKKDMQTEISEVVNLLRFKEVRYLWYEGQDDYTYYTIDSPTDTEIE